MNLAFTVITLTSSFCSMAYSMLLASNMTEITGEEVISQCLTMGPYLLGLGLGSAYGDKIKPERRISSLWMLEWTSVLALPVMPIIQILFVFFFFNLSAPGVTVEGKLALSSMLSVTAILSFFSGVLGGAQLPLILKNEKGLTQEWTLAINYLGPLVAGISIVRMNQATVSLGIQIYLIGLVQILGLLLLVFNFEKALRSLILLFIPLIVLTATAFVYPDVETYTMKSLYMGTRISSEQIKNPSGFIKILKHYGDFERVRTPYQTIDLFIEPPEQHFGLPGNASVYLNRKPQFDLFSVDLYHETMVYSGLNFLKRIPENVLILGAGDGLLLKEFKEIKGINKITMVELDQMMIEWSNTNYFMANLNEGSMNPPAENVELIVGDGVSYLRNLRNKKFDLILIDFPFPNGHDLAKLYSMEFYQLVKRAMADDGVAIMDLPLYLDREEKLSFESKVIVKTLRAAKLGDPILFGGSASFIGFKSHGEKPRFDYSLVPEHLKLESALNLVTPFREDEISEKDWEEVPVNTMFWPKGL